MEERRGAIIRLLNKSCTFANKHFCYYKYSEYVSHTHLKKTLSYNVAIVII